jgi:hypothetical protein
MDPIVIDPPNFDQRAAWDECNEYVEKCGGLSHEDGEPNWRAAFGADPGCCSCPACGTHYWMWGRRQRCVKCSFEYPTDAWPMYSYGTQDARLLSGDRKCPDPEVHKRMVEYTKNKSAKHMAHPYYRYGFENPVDEPYEEFKRLPWSQIFVNKGVLPVPDRHPAVQAVLQFFAYSHLPPHLQDASKPFCELAEKIADGPQNAEATVALRKLLESKDAAVRAVLFK